MDETIHDAEGARRLARTIVSDIALYNKDAAERGIVEDSFFELLADPIAEGRRLFERRAAPELHPLGIFDRALVDVLLKPFGRIKSRIW